VCHPVASSNAMIVAAGLLGIEIPEDRTATPLLYLWIYSYIFYMLAKVVGDILVPTASMGFARLVQAAVFPSIDERVPLCNDFT